MSEVAAHYEDLLARHYTWMLGPSFEALVTEQVERLATCGITPVDRGRALDLGCGSGIQSIALARLGYDAVLGVDISPTLIAELADRAAEFPAVRPIRADVCDGLAAIAEPQSIATAVCMGDTLPHLPDSAAVRRLFADTFAVLEPGGTFLVSFRDLTRPLTGSDRFIPVRSDEDKIMTCFLEDEGDAVRVHDLIHTRNPGNGWDLATSSYRKLRLPPAWVCDQLNAAGFTSVTAEPGPRGTVVVTAQRPS
ncbi:MAG TPA: methyltransferase domain-containing protein [Mycobacteriales bacterium]|nr:methyltransferase domain-containing protein [Mycobacteriales bacterium]